MSEWSGILIELGPYCCLFIFSIIVFIIPIFTGQYFERKHLRDLQRREDLIRNRILIHNRKRPYVASARDPIMVSGTVVIAADRFKTWLAKWRQIVGGRMGSLEPIVDRARREALLRAAETALGQGCSELGNIRYSFASLKWAHPQQKELMICVIVFGTAYRG